MDQSSRGSAGTIRYLGWLVARRSYRIVDPRTEYRGVGLTQEPRARSKIPAVSDQLSAKFDVEFDWVDSIGFRQQDFQDFQDFQDEAEVLGVPRLEPLGEARAISSHLICSFGLRHHRFHAAASHGQTIVNCLDFASLLELARTRGHHHHDCHSGSDHQTATRTVISRRTQFDSPTSNYEDSTCANTVKRSLLPEYIQYSILTEQVVYDPDPCPTSWIRRILRANSTGDGHEITIR